MAIFGIEYVETRRGYFGVEAADEYEALERFNKWRLESDDVYIILDGADHFDNDYWINANINIEYLDEYEILTEEKYNTL